METNIIKLETKVCKTCNIEKDITKYSLCKGKYRKNKCFTCYNTEKYYKYRDKYLEEKKEYHINNKELINKKARLYHANNKESISKKKKEYYHNNIIKRSEVNSIYTKKIIGGLLDPYIKRVIGSYYKLKFKDIPEELVQLKRKQLKLYRYVKQQKNKD